MVVVAIVSAWPAIVQPGLLNTRGGGDSPFLLQRLHQLVAALADGHFPARWMPDANYGYGYPFYNFYAPLSIYIAALFRFIGFSFVRSIHLAQVAGFIVAGLGMFYLGRHWLGSRWAGLLAAVAYTVAPFHMVNVYVRGDSLAEFWAMAFFPLVLLAADRLARSSVISPLSVAFFALVYAGLILSHNISALIFSPFILLVLAAHGLDAFQKPQAADARLAPRRLLVVALAFLLAFALATWFFVPALAERDLTQLGLVTEGYFHFSNHFRGLDLLQNGLIFDYNPDGGIAFRLGVVQTGFALAGAIVLLRLRRSPAHRSITGIILVGLAVAVLMITPLSRPLWEHLPLLSFTQFPWRFLSVASLFGALAAGALVLVTEQAAARAAIATLGSLVLLVAGLMGLQPDFLPLTDADVTAERLAQYEWFTGNIGTTVSAEYLTPESAPRPWTSRWLNAGGRDRVVAVEGELVAELLERRAISQTWRLQAGADGARVIFSTLYWPGWRATIDGRGAELTPWPASGLITVAIPPGEHTIALDLDRPPLRLASELVSLVGLIVVAELILIGVWPRIGSAPLGVGRDRRWLWLMVGGMILVAVAAFLWRGDPRDRPAGDMTWDFAQMGYLHHEPNGVLFSDGARLHEYGYSHDAIDVGSTLTITVSLTPGTATAATIDLTTPASARPMAGDMAEPPALASQTVVLKGDGALFTLTIPADAPAGLYVPRLILTDARPLLPSGGTRGDLFLRPIRVMASDGHSAAGPLSVESPAMAVRDKTTLVGHFVWTTPRPLGSRYQLSWRLLDSDGLVLSQLDAQPGFGFQPTDGWEPGGPNHDLLALRLPDMLEEAAPHPLMMILYDVTTGEQLLLRRVGEVIVGEDGPRYRPVQSVFTPPAMDKTIDVLFADDGRPLIELLGYDQMLADRSLKLTLYWRSMTSSSCDFLRFVHLLDADGAILAQADGHPAGNSYPTGQWVEGEVVADTVWLDISAVPPGTYRLATGFYGIAEGLPRLDVVAADGPLPDGRAILPDPIVIP